MPGTSQVEALVSHGLSTPGLREIAWKAVPPTDLAEYLDVMPDLLIEAPHLANEVATKYVLRRDDCPDLCASLKDVPLDTRTHFASALENLESREDS